MRERAKNLRESIAQKISNKLIHIKVDAATKHRQSFLGINIQFFNDEKNIVELITLGAVEIWVRHTAENLKHIIFEVLEKYGVGIEQIYSFTSDNGANEEPRTKVHF